MENKNVGRHANGVKAQKDDALTDAYDNNRQNNEKMNRAPEKLLPAEAMHSLKPADEELTENTNCETEEILVNRMTSDSNFSTVYTTESRIAEDVHSETTTDSSRPPSPATSSASDNKAGSKQMSGTNRTGKKVYFKSFLLKFENAVICQKKPECLVNKWDIITKSSNPSQCSSSDRTATNFFSRPRHVTGALPLYSKFNNGFRRSVMPQRQPSIAKRDNWQEKVSSKAIHMSHSSSNEVDLNRTENAWRPTIAAKKAGSSINASSVTDEEINKNVRSILNKITPDNIAVLTERFVALPVDTIERLENTIDLVFEKAIQEQSFAPLYAAVCAAMQSVQVSCAESQKITSFKQLIIRKCQGLFETDNTQEIDSVKKLTEINSCKDPEKKKELQFEYEENERKLRRRSVGNCRFIGELFIQNMLNPNIVQYCIANLVSQHSEEPLECLCNLLRTTGKQLERCCNLNDTFKKLEALASNKSESKISSRIRFMIQDIMDLRKDKWSPRRLENKPRMIKEIEEEVKKEAMVQSSTYKCEKKQSHNRIGNKIRGSDYKNHRGNYNNRKVQANIKCKQQNYNFDQHKLRGLKDTSLVTSLSPSRKWPFSRFPRAGKKSTTPAEASVATNELMSTKYDDRAASRPPSNSESAVSAAEISKKTVNSDNLPAELDSAEVDERIHTLCKNIIDEYEQMHNLDDVIYSLVEDNNSCVRTKHQQFVTSTSLITLNGSANSRTEAAKMFEGLLSKKVLSVTAITQGLDTVLKDWDDYLTDYPYFFSYVAAIVAPLLLSKTASFEFSNLKYACSSIRPHNSSVFFAEVLQTILRYENTQNVQNVNEFGDTLRTYNTWRMQSKYVPLNVFIPDNQINKCFKNDQVGVLLLSMTIHEKTRLIDSNKPLYDATQKWIRKNINEEIIKLPCFIRTLIISTAIVCSNKLKDDANEDFFDRGHGKLLNYYIRSVYTFSASQIREREVQCIKGSQIISTILREQQNSEDKALRPFYELYRDRAITKESFDAWKDEEEFDENSTKTTTIAVLSSLFLEIDTKK